MAEARLHRKKAASVLPAASARLSGAQARPKRGLEGSQETASGLARQPALSQPIDVDNSVSCASWTHRPRRRSLDIPFKLAEKSCAE